uniref:F-box associated beta-propeller type 3 domain-containing protein n=2 Tax=Lactuca sativa TaxID=4236 RepID=A0A9R1UNT6_LACSA|nr:hypothetical protein LSAT_V11C800423330 [Lactuca sativa]
MEFKLCDDMVKTEILSRTSLKTLDVMRCISKEFEKLTYEPYLLDLYKQRNDIVSGFLMQRCGLECSEYIHEFAPSRGSKSIDLGFLPRNARILASSEQGIIVFQSPYTRFSGSISYYVCKPATKQVVPLPNPRTRYTTEKIAIVVVGSNPVLHYKIIRLSSSNFVKRRGEFYRTYRCEIFDSTTWVWKLMDLLLLPSSVSLDMASPVITTRGSIYMLLLNNDILKFDSYSEKWTTFSSPIQDRDYELYTSRQLVKHDGRLGYFCKSSINCGCEFWVLGTDAESWEKIYVFNKEESEDINNTRNLELFDDPNASVKIWTGVFLFYKEKTIVSKRSDDQMFVYRSDFEPINLKLGKQE